MESDSICDIYADGKKVGEFLWKSRKQHKNLFNLTGIEVKDRESGRVVPRTNFHGMEEDE